MMTSRCFASISYDTSFDPNAYLIAIVWDVHSVKKICGKLVFIFFVFLLGEVPFTAMFRLCHLIQREVVDFWKQFHFKRVNNTHSHSLKGLHLLSVFVEQMCAITTFQKILLIFDKFFVLFLY